MSLRWRVVMYNDAPMDLLTHERRLDSENCQHTFMLEMLDEKGHPMFHTVKPHTLDGQRIRGVSPDRYPAMWMVSGLHGAGIADSTTGSTYRGRPVTRRTCLLEQARLLREMANSIEKVARKGTFDYLGEPEPELFNPE